MEWANIDLSPLPPTLTAIKIVFNILRGVAYWIIFHRLRYDPLPKNYSLLVRWIRIIGNDYCKDGVPAHTSSNGIYICEEITSQCEGQIKRISQLDGYVEVIDTNWNEDYHDEL